MDNGFDTKSVLVVSPLRGFAVQTHELFTELTAVGFNEEQAIKICVGLASRE